jgi:large subunit ribosomal protein L10
MPLTREQKQQLVESYQSGFSAAPHAFLLGFRGITVPLDAALRSKVRESGGQYLVVKNRLALRAIESGSLAELREHFDGPTAVAYSATDAVALAKALADFAKDFPGLEFKVGVVDGRPVAGEDIKAIAQLPTREELMAKLLFLMQASVSGFVRVLAALPRRLVVALDQVSRKKAVPEA